MLKITLKDKRIIRTLYAINSFPSLNIIYVTVGNMLLDTDEEVILSFNDVLKIEIEEE